MTKASRQQQDKTLVERWRLLGRAACDKKLSRTDAAVLFAILDSMFYGKPCFMSLDTIAKKCGASSTQVAKSITRLLAGGYLDRTRSSGPGRANTYRLPMARPMNVNSDNHSDAEICVHSGTHLAAMTADSAAKCLSDRAQECLPNATHQTEIEANSDRKQRQDTYGEVRWLLANRGFMVGNCRRYIERFVAAGGTPAILEDYLAMPDCHGKPANWTLQWATREMTESAAILPAVRAPSSVATSKTMQGIHSLEAMARNRGPRLGLADRWPSVDAIDADFTVEDKP